ncbi:sigma-70 family RNA polymerase sigma factor [Lentibacillus saliphilus]|uniref:sigma-70 family RNA polymerase sigma factor n=1 Tax=Lentibacillus saliphilus TaxID=2737028 RepID=UPI0031BB69DD
MSQQNFTFEEIFKQNERRIHYHIHRLNIRDPHDEYFQEGLCALWNAYEKYEPDKGPMATYFNFTIKNRLIDRIRKESRASEVDELIVAERKNELEDGNHISRSTISYPLMNNQKHIPLTNDELWLALEKHLTKNQWKWVYYYIVEDWPLKDIAEAEHTTVDAVKSWGKQVRKKLRDDTFRKMVGWEVET